jgi:thiol-disulfide isomerase/thioredoxin
MRRDQRTPDRRWTRWTAKRERRVILVAWGLAAGVAAILLAGCDKVNLVGSLMRSGTGEVQASGEAEVASASPTGLVGATGVEVKALLGQPQGRLHAQGGVVWLYPEWRVQFDAREQVVSVEREVATVVEATSPGKVPVARAPGGGVPTGQRALTVVANGGQELDLKSYLVAGKVTVVDFYADWCGPCRQVAPHLERLAREDGEVNVVKVDIVKWNTPVARQYGITSIPHLRVYDRLGRVVGGGTSNFRQVLAEVEKAKR